jgi:hypothetical protein
MWSLLRHAGIADIRRGKAVYWAGIAQVIVAQRTGDRRRAPVTETRTRRLNVSAKFSVSNGISFGYICLYL